MAPASQLTRNRPLGRRAFLARGACAAMTLPFAVRAWADLPRGAFRVTEGQPRGLAASPNGQLAFALDDRVVFHALDGQCLRVIEARRAVTALCFDNRSQLFVALGNQIERLTDAGAFAPLGKSLGDHETSITGLAIAEDGTMFAADSGRRVIWRLNANGTATGEIKPSARGFSVSPTFFPIAWRAGRLHVAESARHRVHAYSAGGERLATWGAHSREAAGFSGCCNPVALTTLADGTVVTAERGQTRVKSFTPEGRFLRQLAGPDDFTAGPLPAPAEAESTAACERGLLDLAATTDNAIALLDRSTREVRVFR